MTETTSNEPNIQIKHNYGKPTQHNNLINKVLYDLLKLGIILIILLYLVYVTIKYDESVMTLMTTTESPNGTIVIACEETECMEPSYYKHPVIMSWAISDYSSHLVTCDKKTCNLITRTKSDKCRNISAQAYIFDAMRITDLPLPRNNRDIWVLDYEETPRYFLLLYNDYILRLFNYSSTYSRYSDVPFPLFYMRNIKNINSLEYYVNTTAKNRLLSRIAPVLFLSSDCDTFTERDNYVKELMKYIPIDSYGTCLKNKKLPKPLQSKTGGQMPYEHPKLLRYVAKYKFTIAIENAVCNDYVTEKFWRTIHVGSVPIYFGSPRIRDWMPNNKSAILLTDYPTPVIMANYIKSLLANDTLYEQHLEHKTKGLISNKLLLNELKNHPYQLELENKNSELFCFVCKKVYEAMNTKVSRTIDRNHFDCPLPTSALDFRVNPNNHWVVEALLTKKSNIGINEENMLRFI